MGDVHDVDADLRNELERDLRNIVAKRIPKLDGMIVSGDIAYSGQQEEFVFASGWIEKIRELANCPKRGVMVTPGNHDIDWSAMPLDSDVHQLHESIRAATTTQERDVIIADILRDEVRGPLLLVAMAAYNKFAEEYACSVSAQIPYWEKNFPLGNKGTLRIRGMTSTLISGPNDNILTHRMVYGGGQRTLLRGDRMYRVVVGHHPPSWTFEGDDADRIFTDRAAIQLFGHKHDNWYHRPRGIRVIAGAVHPERQGSQWDPRYSVISVRLQEDGNLATRVYPRRWSHEETTFIPDYNSQGKDYRDHVVPPDWPI